MWGSGCGDLVVASGSGRCGGWKLRGVTSGLGKGLDEGGCGRRVGEGGRGACGGALQ